MKGHTVIELNRCEVCGATAALQFCATCGSEQRERCQRVSMLTGTGCDLAVGHEGEHVRTYTNTVAPYSVRWADEGDRRGVDREADKTLGT